MPAAKVQFTADQRARMCQRYLAGESTGAIAGDYGTWDKGVWRILQRAGVQLRPRGETRIILKQSQMAEVCTRYRAGESAEAIATSLGVANATVNRALHRAGVTLRPSHPTKLQAAHETICQRYAAGESLSTLAGALNVTPRAIRCVLEKHDVARRSVSEGRRQFTCDHSFFSVIDTEARAYWLGFIAADGHIGDHGRLSVQLAPMDRDHLQAFLLALGSDYPIHQYDRPDGKQGVVVTIVSHQMLSDLARLGVVPHKVETRRWPDLPDLLMRHFLRGYFDGDGCWGIQKRDARLGPAVSFSLAANLAFCEGCQTWLMAELGLRRTKLTPLGINQVVYQLNYGGNKQVARIADLIYRDASVYLARKRGRVARLLDSGGGQYP